MRRRVSSSRHADVRVRLAKVHWHQLRVTVGEVEQRDLFGTYGRQPIEIIGRRQRVCDRRRERQRRGNSGCDGFEKLASRHRLFSRDCVAQEPLVYLRLTGERRSIRYATTSAICSGVRNPLRPKRGIWEQG